MRIRPSGVELLRAARVVMIAAIAPHLADDRRAALGTIERAMALAEDRLTRDVEASDTEIAELENARVAMRRDVLEALPEERRYDARLAAKAIAVATRVLANGHGPERRECERLVALLDAPTLADATPAEISCRLPSLNERLVTRIRAGEADAGTTTYEATLAHLEAITQEALSESNPAYRRRASEPVSSVAPVDALLTAWSDVPRTFMRAFPLAVSPVPIAQRIDAWLHLPGVTLEAVYASGNAAFATQAGLFGWFAQRLAANPRVPMIAVESAHQAHDLSIAFSDVSAALFELWMWPFRRVEACAADTARLP